MKVTLIDYTGKGKVHPELYAAALLIFTKSTRLEMKPGLFEEIQEWPYEKMDKELRYMANTIPSSWEFVDYTFLVEGVTRAFTHQFVRSRQFSFAQQTMRVLNVSGWEFSTGPSIAKEDFRKSVYHKMMGQIAATYNSLIQQGALVEDARGILPTNILTNIVGKCNMRTFVELVRKRSSPRTQDEYRLVLNGMINSVKEVHPWIDIFIERTFDVAANELCDKIKDLPVEPHIKTDLIKLTDQNEGTVMTSIDQWTTGQPTHYLGKVCELHPELEGKRYTHRNRCVACFKDSGQKRKEDKAQKYQIWFEQEGKCLGCKIDLCSEHATLDHIKAIAKGGTHDRSNKQVLCFKCNAYKHDKENGQWEHKIKPIVWYKDVKNEIHPS